MNFGTSNNSFIRRKKAVFSHCILACIAMILIIATYSAMDGCYQVFGGYVNGMAHVLWLPSNNQQRFGLRRTEPRNHDLTT